MASNTAPVINLAQFRGIVSTLIKTKAAQPDMYLTPILWGI